MIRSREVFSPLLEHALVANRVVSCLKRGQFNKESQQAFADAIQFLDKMLHGHQQTSSLTINDDSYQNALAYEEGVKAFGSFLPLMADSDSVKFIKALTETATALEAGNEVSQDSRDRFEKFFAAVRDITLKAESKPLEEARF
jgi:O-succinylbenzoate synthase